MDEPGDFDARSSALEAIVRGSLGRRGWVLQRAENSWDSITPEDRDEGGSGRLGQVRDGFDGVPYKHHSDHGEGVALEGCGGWNGEDGEAGTPVSG